MAEGLVVIEGVEEVAVEAAVVGKAEVAEIQWDMEEIWYLGDTMRCEVWKAKLLTLAGRYGY
jgi:hypothetical protein